MSHLIEPAELLGRLGRPGVRVVDCRFVLGSPGAGEQLWLEGHIPGASYLDVDRDLSAPPSRAGRHPLPARADFEAAARGAGICAQSPVVAYDEAGEGGAARLWWLLRHFGGPAALVLNGGLRAWREAGGPLRAGAEEVPPGDLDAVAAPDGRDTVSLAQLAHAAPLLDARAPERYRGEVEPVDAVAGHIEGARNLHFAELQPEGRFLEPAELRARLAAAGVTAGRDAVAYCGSGVTASTLVLAAELAGLGPMRLYPGSFSEWTRRGMPVAQGPEARQQATRSTSSRSNGPGGVRSA
jgi:thiosulfate/3-mercaptopyruvate sulfurtransferase